MVFSIVEGLRFRLPPLFWLLVFLCLPTFASSQFDNAADIASISIEPANNAHITYSDGTVTEAWPQSLGNNRETAFLASDFSGDGKDDIACIDFDDNDDATLFLTRSPGFSGADQETWTNELRASTNELTYYFVAGDFNGDVSSDMAAFYIDATGNDTDIFAKITFGPTGSSQTSGASDWSFPGERDSAFVPGRFLGTGASNDDISDVAAISDQGGGNFLAKIFIGPSGTHAVIDEWAFTRPTPDSAPVQFRGGDYNGDGDADIAAIFYDSVAGDYNARIVFGPDGASTEVWAFGVEDFVAFLGNDFDGDGIDDIAGVIQNVTTRDALISFGSSAGTVASTTIWNLVSVSTSITTFLDGKFHRPNFYSISGTVYQTGGVTGLANVTVSTDTGATTTTDANGDYILSDLPNGSYVVTPTKASYAFSPASDNVDISGASVSSIDFTATSNPTVHKISGRVTLINGITGVSGVTVSTNTGGTDVTDSNGDYEISALANGTHIVTPSGISGQTFDPTQRTVTINGGNQTGKNFTTSIPGTFSISGSVKFSDGGPIIGAVVSTGSHSATTNASGNYTISLVPPGSYTLSATLAGHNITSNNFSNPVIVLTSNLSNKKFLSSCASGFIRDGNSCVIEGEAPEAPTGLVASDGISPDHVVISWNAASGAQTYQLFRSRFNDETGLALGEPISNISFIDTTAVPGVDYYYKVLALNSFGQSDFSNTDLGFRSASVEDCDGDGVPDQQELLDGTGVCDAGSFVTTLKSPIFSSYNTFSSPNIFLELNSVGTKAVIGSISVFDIAGTLLATQAIHLNPFQEFDFSIHDLIDNDQTYGVVRVDFNDSTPGALLRGRISQYRPNDNGDGFDFAYSKELRNPTKGDTFAIANTIDPQGGGNIVLNWAEIVNTSDEPQTFTAESYDQDGNQVDDPITFTLRPNARRDFAGGHQFDQQGVYAIRFVPQDGAAEYLAGITRYGTDSLEARADVTYNFSTHIEARAGTGDVHYVTNTDIQGECWSQINWIEVLNTRSKDVDVTLIFRNLNGQEVARFTENLGPLAQRHFNASPILRSVSSGFVEIQSGEIDAIITQSSVYVYNCAGDQFQTAFSSQGRIPGKIKVIGSYNNFLNQNSFLRIINTNTQDTDVMISLFDLLGEERSEVIEQVASKFVRDYDLKDKSLFNTNPEEYGTIRINSNQPQEVVAETLRYRVKDDGNIDFGIPTLLY